MHFLLLTLIASLGIVALNPDEGANWGAQTRTQSMRQQGFEPPQVADFATPVEDTALACVRKDGKFGFLNLKGDMVIPARYDSARNFAEGRAAVRQRGKWGFVDRSGNKVIKTLYQAVGPFFSEGKCSFKKDGRWGYLDRMGKLAIAPKYEEALPFYDGRAAVRTADGWGLIDTKGQFLIQPLYVSVTQGFCHGIFLFTEDMKVRGLDRNGRPVQYLSNWNAPPEYHEGLAAFHNKQLDWGYVNKLGDTVITPQFANANRFREGLAAVNTYDLRWGYIKPDGSFQIPSLFRGAMDFQEGLAGVVQEYGLERYGFIDKTGNWVVKPNFTKVLPFYQGTAWVQVEYSWWGLIDKQGEFVIQPQFTGLSEVTFSAGYLDANLPAGLRTRLEVLQDCEGKPWHPAPELTWVLKDGKWGLIDRKGAFILEPELDTINYFR